MRSDVIDVMLPSPSREPRTCNVADVSPLVGLRLIRTRGVAPRAHERMQESLLQTAVETEATVVAED
jgi:hypothetical protein